MVSSLSTVGSLGLKISLPRLKRRTRGGKRIYLNDTLTIDLISKLHDYFLTKVYIPRVKRGRKQELETLINEEAFLVARYLRLKGESWVPRIAVP